MTQLVKLGVRIKGKAAARWKAQKHRAATVLAIGQVAKTVVSPLAPAMTPPPQPLASPVYGPAILRSVGDEGRGMAAKASTEQFAEIQKMLHKGRRARAMDAAQADRSQVSGQRPSIPKSKAPERATRRSTSREPKRG
jgi:hypothetical protein